MQDVFANDIVILTSSGNFVELYGYEDVDRPPKIWATEDSPLIVVGSVNSQGKIAPKPGQQKSFSQGGHCLGTWERRDMFISHQH